MKDDEIRFDASGLTDEELAKMVEIGKKEQSKRIMNTTWVYTGKKK